MNGINVNILAVVGLVLLALIVFLIWKNKKDRKSVNPDASNAAEEARMDQNRRENKS